ncbi:MAG TPA: hypothetical protein VK171_13255, partial [Fimbriimonas sp.]|nr:hypothetical protein [Fimbriimonas sp.]
MKLRFSALMAAASCAVVSVAWSQTPITQWKLANFTSAQLMTNAGADEADPNGDGTPNLLAYAFALTPQQPVNAV